MINALTHTTVWVLDQDEAKAFYTDKLGFEVRNDLTMDGFRWLTVAPPDQTDHELILMQPATPMLDEESVAQMRALIAKGALGPGVFATADCQQAFEELSARGVTFLQEPSPRPYGIEATFRDDSGSWYSLTQPIEPAG